METANCVSCVVERRGDRRGGLDTDYSRSGWGKWVEKGRVFKEIVWCDVHRTGLGCESVSGCR